MAVNSRLVFDPTAIASSHTVGAYLLGGTSGGVLTDSVSGKLDVTVGNASIPVTDNGGSLTVDGTVAATQSGTWDIGTVTTVTAVTSITNAVAVTDNSGSLTVDASDLDIRDLTHVSDSVKIGDGTDLLAVNADGSINCVVTGDTSDTAIANTAVAATAKAVSTALIDLVTSPLSNRKYLFAANMGNKIVFLGTTATDATTGFPLEPGVKMEMRAGAALPLKVIGETGASSEDIRVLEIS